MADVALVDELLKGAGGLRKGTSGSGQCTWSMSM